MEDKYRFGKVMFQMIFGRRPVTEKDMESVREINEMAREALRTDKAKVHEKHEGHEGHEGHNEIREKISDQLTGKDAETLRNHL